MDPAAEIFSPSPSTTSPSLMELTRLQDDILRRQMILDAKKKEYEEESKIVELMKQKMIAYMNDGGLTNFRTAAGQLVLNRRFNVTVPKGEDLDKFLGGIPTDAAKALRTVNYQSLNSWYKAELEAAKARGDVDFSVPGLAEPTMNEYLSVRK